MIKILGSMLILTGFGCAWFSTLYQWRQETQTLGDLLAVLGEMSDQIRLTRIPLPRLFRKLSNTKHSAVNTWLTNMGNALEQGEAIQTVWIAACKELPVENDMQKYIAELAYKLSGDEESILQGISLVSGWISDRLNEKQRKRRDCERQATALCFSGAALLIILLL